MFIRFASRWTLDPFVSLSHLLLIMIIINPLISVQASWLDGKVKPIDQEILSDPELFQIHGSNTLGAKLLPELVLDYMKAKGIKNLRTRPVGENEKLILGAHNGKEIRVKIEAHGSGTAFVGLKDGRAQMGAASRRIKQGEASSLERIGNMTSKESEHVVAIDGIAIVVNESNPVKELTINQVAELFSGKITSWNAVGGRSGRVVPYARDAASGTWDTFNSMVFRKQYELVPTAQRFESNSQVAQMVEQSANALGFVGVATINDTKPIALHNAGDQALMPSVLTIATEDYPLARRLYLYTPSVKPNLTAEFIDYVLSNPGQEVVDRMGFVSQKIRPVEIEKSNLPPEYRVLIETHTRLSLNFRFKSNTADMDGKAELDVERLAHYMSTSAKGKRILLVGFDNDQGNDARSKIISKLRAVNVKRRLRGLGVSADVESLGAKFFIADPKTKQGEAKNQRVEVWIK